MRSVIYDEESYYKKKHKGKATTSNKQHHRLIASGAIPRGRACSTGSQSVGDRDRAPSQHIQKHTTPTQDLPSWVTGWVGGCSRRNVLDHHAAKSVWDKRFPGCERCVIKDILDLVTFDEQLNVYIESHHKARKRDRTRERERERERERGNEMQLKSL